MPKIRLRMRKSMTSGPGLSLGYTRGSRMLNTRPITNLQSTLIASKFFKAEEPANRPENRFKPYHINPMPQNQQRSLSLRTPPCSCARMYVCICMCICICMHFCICMYMCVYICVYVCMCVCKHYFTLQCSPFHSGILTFHYATIKFHYINITLT